MNRSSLPIFEVFFDGDCPLCTKEIQLLRRLDRSSRIQFTDISIPSFDAPAHCGLSLETLMAEIHGRLEGAGIVTGVEVFRQLYARTPLFFLVPPSRLWGIRHLFDFAYRFFAKNRLKFTGRCENNSCALPSIGQPDQDGVRL